MAQLNFNPFPVLRTERLVLREITLDDMHELFLLRSNADAMKYISKPLAKHVDQIKELIVAYNANSATNQAITWGISLHNEAAVIGTMGLFNIQPEHNRAEIGYMLHPEHWRKGLVSEAMRIAIDYAFNTMQLHSLEANIHPGNEASEGILKKHGFVQEGYFRESYYFDGVYGDAAIFSLLNK